MRIAAVILKVAVALNALSLAALLIVSGKYGFYAEDLRDWAVILLGFVCPSVTLVTLVLALLKKTKILVAALKVISVVLNISFLIWFIGAVVTQSVNIEFSVGGCGWLLLLVLLFVYPFVNLSAMALTLRE